jgi:hypothetical protein
LAGYEAFYTNGVLCASISMFNNMIDPAAYYGPAYNDKSILAYTLGNDPTNYIGESLYPGDPGLQANIDEFRIYNGALTQAQIAADYALGPNVLPSSAPMLSAYISGHNLIITWPVSGSSGYNLMESAVIGSGASWSPAGGTPTVIGGNYQVSIPISLSASAAFFRLMN